MHKMLCASCKHSEWRGIKKKKDLSFSHFLFEFDVVLVACMSLAPEILQNKGLDSLNENVRKNK